MTSGWTGGGQRVWGKAGITLHHGGLCAGPLVIGGLSDSVPRSAKVLFVRRYLVSRENRSMKEQCSLASCLFSVWDRREKPWSPFQSLSTKDLLPTVMVYSLFPLNSLCQVFCGSGLSFLLKSMWMTLWARQSEAGGLFPNPCVPCSNLHSNFCHIVPPVFPPPF